MEIYIIRHGETVWNKDKRIQGRADIELNDYGRELAVKTGQALRDVRIDYIYASPLKRAYETALLIRGDRDIIIEKDDRIREVSFGIYEGRRMDELIADGTSFKDFFDHPEEYVPGDEGESLNELIERGKNFLDDILKKHCKDCERIMVVAHGAMNKAIMMSIKNQPLSEFWSGGLQKNCNVIIVDYDEGRKDRFRILEEQKIFY